jgi:membrane protease YdiL (CAAX protease family)
MVAGYVLSIVGAVAGSLVLGSSAILAVVLSSVGLYSALLGACRWASQRYGSGSVRRDLGLVWHRRDVLAAVGYALAARLGVVGVGLGLHAIHPSLARGNLEGVDLRRDVAASIILAIVAVFVAPVVEELFFRGLLLRALSHPLTDRGAQLAQAMLFGVMHAGVGYGVGNVGVVLSTAMVGMVLGHVASREGRLGTAVLTHSLHNAASLIAVLAITG